MGRVGPQILRLRSVFTIYWILQPVTEPKVIGKIKPQPILSWLTDKEQLHLRKKSNAVGRLKTVLRKLAFAYAIRRVYLFYYKISLLEIKILSVINFSLCGGNIP